MKYLLIFIFPFLRSGVELNFATQQAMPPEFGRKWGTECLNARFPLPTLLCAGYSVKLIYIFYCFRYLHSGNLTIAVLILTEYSNPKLRGIFLTASAAAFFWGIWISNVIGTFFNWRIITLLGFICSLYTLTVFLWPESPHWLAGKGRFEECKAAFRRLHGFTAEKELQALITAKEEYIKLEKSEVEMSFFDIIKCPEFYKPMVLALMAVFQYQFTGKMICSVFILDIFKKITASEYMAYMAMLILNGVTVISMYVGSYLSKVMMRRTLYMSSSFIGVAFLLIISLYIYLGKANITEENNYILILLLTVYTIAISCGPMILSMSIYGELFSTRFQSGSYIIISLVISSSYSILYKMTPTIFADLGIHGSFLLYGIICGLCTFYLYVFLPETKNKTQWEIEEYFRGNKRQTDPLLYR